MSSVAFVGLIALRWDQTQLNRRLPLAIAGAVGVLFGESVFHLIPESLSGGLKPLLVATLIALGASASYGIEKLLRFFAPSSSVAPVARISLAAESAHNGIDGALIAAAYLASTPIGLIATLTIAVHELPHELSNFAILIDSGYSRKEAILLNFASACTAFLGAGMVLLGGRAVTEESRLSLPVAAGCFIYVALVDLLPGIWKSDTHPSKRSLGAIMTGGAAVMLVLARAG